MFGPGFRPPGWTAVARDEEQTLIYSVYQRNLPARGFRPAVLLLITGGVVGYGWYHLTKGIRERKYVGPPSTALPERLWVRPGHPILSPGSTLAARL